MITVTAIKCPLCKVTIYSRATHDFRSCVCGAVSIDGGFDYLHGAWDTKKIADMPKPIKVKVNATKEQLYHDWNNREDKFGIILPKVENRRKFKRQMNRKIHPALQERSSRKKKI